MKISREPRIEGANVPNSQYDDFRALVLVEAKGFVARALRHSDRLGAFCSRLRAERKPIFFHTRHGAKEIAIANVSGIVCHAEDE